MNYLSVCSGIEAATVAWHHMGWNPLAFSEIEKFPSEVLAHHYPAVPNLGDMTKYKEWDFGTNRLDLLVGGTPCQSFSVAGLRKGLEDPRGNLMLTYVGILDKFRPKWCVWENVPGVLSSNGGKDFGSFLGALAELGYGWSYRVLDAQHFGVAQRRKRVFVIGCSSGWEHSAKVLFESYSLQRNIKESRKSGKETSTSFIPSVVGTLDRECGGSKLNHQTANSGHIIPAFWNGSQLADTLTRTSDDQRMPDKNRMQVVVEPIFFENSRRDAVRIFDKVSNTLQSFMGTGGGNVPIVSMQDTSGRDKAQNGKGWSEENKAYTLDTQGLQGIASNMAVRRLTPIECERLQGFSDDYTKIKENCPDGHRYRALGNSMAVPVMKWIGERIERL
jgi:DNA (cytosine-5)-methyltransferase 1